MFPFRLLILCLGGVAAYAAARAETVLVSEKFADGSRSGQNLPSSLDWYCSVSGRFLQEGKGFMSLTGATESARHAVAHFATPDKAVTLEKGQSLTMSFDFKPLAGGPPSGNSLRFGLFNSENDAANIFQADGQNPMAASASGYVGTVGSKTETAASLAIMKRSGQGGLLTNSHAYNTLKSAPGSFSLQPDQTYTLKLTVKRTASETVEIEAELTGEGLSSPVTVTFEDAAEPVFTFDTVGFSIFKSIVDAEFSTIQVVKQP